MTDSWNLGNEELAQIASTVPLLASLTVLLRDGTPVGQWLSECSPLLDAAGLARLLPRGVEALGPGPHEAPSLTLTTLGQTVVVTELWSEGLVVFGFREAVSSDWSAYYVRRALGLLLKRH